MTQATQTEFKNNCQSYFSEEHNMFRAALRKFLEKEAVPVYGEWEKQRLVPREFWRKLGDNGFLCPYVDEEYGGAGGDFLMTVVMAEEFAKIGAGLSAPGTHSNIVVPYIHTYGSKEQKEKYLPGCVSGEIITAIAMTEPGAGSDLSNIRTTAVKDGDNYIINGQKTFITNGILADLVVVACKTNLNAEPAYRGISLFLVEASTPGFSRGRKLDKVGLHSQDTAELVFEDMRVPATSLLGEEGRGFKYLMSKLQQERICAALHGQVASEDMLEMTIKYVKEREAFGKKISDFQNTQFKLAEIATQVYLGRTFIDNLIVRHNAGEELVKEVSMAKYWITDMTRRISADCMQLHGGYGYMEEYEIARRYRDVAVLPIFAGTNEIMKVIISKQLGL